MRQTLPVWPPQALGAPTAPFVGLDTLWIQLTGTWCNLECAHCLNASGPRDPWLKPLAPAVVRAAIATAERLGVREIYFTGGEPFLHAEAVALIGESLAVAATTVLTNGTLVTDDVADALAALARGSRYSLEIRVSLDDVEETVNDAIRGAGAWAGALRAVARRHRHQHLHALRPTSPVSGLPRRAAAPCEADADVRARPPLWR
jgi:AdoMet-dependent heme synthase